MHTLQSTFSVEQPTALASRPTGRRSTYSSSPSSSSSSSSSGRSLGDQRFAYRSMADMDWGWKKRKR